MNEGIISIPEAGTSDVSGEWSEEFDMPYKYYNRDRLFIDLGEETKTFTGFYKWEKYNNKPDKFIKIDLANINTVRFSAPNNFKFNITGFDEINNKVYGHITFTAVNQSLASMRYVIRYLDGAKVVKTKGSFRDFFFQISGTEKEIMFDGDRFMVDYPSESKKITSFEIWGRTPGVSESGSCDLAELFSEYLNTWLKSTKLKIKDISGVNQGENYYLTEAPYVIRWDLVNTISNDAPLTDSISWDSSVNWMVTHFKGDNRGDALRLAAAADTHTMLGIFTCRTHSNSGSGAPTRKYPYFDGSTNIFDVSIELGKGDNFLYIEAQGSGDDIHKTIVTKRISIYQYISAAECTPITTMHSNVINKKSTNHNIARLARMSPHLIAKIGGRL